MYLIDTHSHIFLEEFDVDCKEVITRATEVSVKKFCLPNIDTETVLRLHDLCDKYPAICFPMMGLHPTSVGKDFKRRLNEIHLLFKHRKYIAIGEIGIDLYWNKTFYKEQIEAFKTQLLWSVEMNLPVAIHTREAFNEVFGSISKIGASSLRGVFHSFGGIKEELETALKFENFYLGINGSLTFKNSQLKDYLTLAPLNRILLETDAPYLAPVPCRGRRNEPSFIIQTAAKLSEIYGVSIETVAEITTGNAERLFAINTQH
ncbi:MAG: TatD family hydrolase [Dysgonamonadaceae bacterium]|jgi:TatD DNase family protein|nr:TatD family hydrolase [Dysgonamonadaceae bacterium]